MIGSKKYKRGVCGLIEDDFNICKCVNMVVLEDMEDKELIIEELVIIDIESIVIEISLEEFKEMLVDI